MQDTILQEVKYTSLNGESALLTERIIVETPLAIRVNGKNLATAMITATMEKEFVTGFLFGRGIIGSAGDIESFKIKDNTAEVRVRGDAGKRGKKAPTDSDLTVRKEDIFDCVRAILKSEIFEETEAVHSAGLFQNGSEAICIAEDLGRHNAFDKVIGYALLNGIDFNDVLAASTGRQPSEMILKCMNAGIPIISTKGVPTTLAIEMAEEARITIAGLVRGETMLVYSTPARIL
jgi:FdhD protein